MLFLGLPNCPYCHKKIDFLYSLTIKSNGEFHCPVCNMTSDIKYTKKINSYFWTACLISLVFLLLWIIFINDYILLGLLAVAAPFIIFYIKVPSVMVLRKPRKDKIARGMAMQSSFDDKTRIIGSIKQDATIEDIDNDRIRINKIEDVPIQNRDLDNK